MKEFVKQLGEVHQARDEFLESKGILEKLLKRGEKFSEKLEKIGEKDSLWSSICYFYFYRQLGKSLAGAKVERAIMDMRLDKWQSALKKLNIDG